MSRPRQLTKEECRKRFLYELLTISQYWGEHPNLGEAPQRVSGAINSVLALIDGVVDGFPAVSLSLDPGEDHEAEQRAEGENWFPSGEVFNGRDYLHEMFINRDFLPTPEEVYGIMSRGHGGKEEVE